MNKEEKLAKAIAFAAEKHANQKRKDGTPYIFHPLAVAELLKRYDYDIDYQVAGILHDVLEDTDTTDDEVRAFGEDVYEAVKLVTRPKGADEAEYVKNILDNRMAAAVKNADKVHNMCDIITTNNRSTILNYAKKVEKYYKGKFSYALDNASLYNSWSQSSQQSRKLQAIHWQGCYLTVLHIHAVFCMLYEAASLTFS